MNNNRTIHILNVPCDSGASRKGASGGPAAFRVAGLRDAIESLGYPIIAESDLALPTPADLSRRDEILDICTRLAAGVKQALDGNEWPLVIGGDHSIAMGTVAGVSAHLRHRRARLGVIWFDAHGDMNLPETSPSGNAHGMPLAHLLGYGDEGLSNILGTRPALDARNCVLIGLRRVDPVERRFILDTGLTTFTMHDIDRLGMHEVAQRALAVVNNATAGFHVSFDLDGCDPEVIPGTGTTVPGGVSLREAHTLLEHCADDGRMTSMEVVELNPFLDHANISAERATALILSALGSSIL